MNSASTCRNGASAFPRMTLRNCSAMRTSSSRHSAKVGGAPAVASRFLHRLEAVAGEERWKAREGGGEKYVHYAGAIDQPAKIEPIEQPEPKPPRETRPTRLSVTAIEDWLRDPYTIYARHILRLDPLDPVDMPLSAADRGSAIHDALGEFTTNLCRRLPADPAGVLRGIGEKHFAPLMERPEARALWWPRFQRIARWFAEWETARRGDITAISAETRGEIKIPLGNDRIFTLSARADRIERRRDGSYAILDYKTGAPPTGKTGADGPVAAAHAGGGDPARGRLSRYRRGLLGRRTRLCQTERQQSAGRAQDAGIEDQAERHAAATG